MIRFCYFEEENAPPASRPLMEKSRQVFGMLPNLHRVLAAAPVTYETYLTAFDLFMNHSSFSHLEAQVVFMTANTFNSCHYCTAGHSMGMTAEQMPEGVICALRDEEPLQDHRLRALQRFTRELLENRGHVSPGQLDAFLEAGFSRAQALEVLSGLAAKLISNFTNAMAQTELDEPMLAFAWKPNR